MQKLAVTTKFNLSEENAAPFLSLQCPQMYVLMYIPTSSLFPLHIPTINSNSSIPENPIILSALFTALDMCYFRITYLCLALYLYKKCPINTG